MKNKLEGYFVGCKDTGCMTFHMYKYFFYCLTVAWCPFPTITEGCARLQGLHEAIHHTSFISLCENKEQRQKMMTRKQGALSLTNSEKGIITNVSKYLKGRKRIQTLVHDWFWMLFHFSWKQWVPTQHRCTNEHLRSQLDEAMIWSVILLFYFVWICERCHSGLSFFPLIAKKEEYTLRDRLIQAEEPQDESIHWCSLTDIFSVANTGELSALYKDLVWSRSIPNRSIIV